MMNTSDKTPWWAYAILLTPKTIQRNLHRVRDAGLVQDSPNLWQLSLGVLRMWHRLAFRPETVGTCKEHAVRKSWRARLLAPRPLRFPFLLAEGAVAPLDLTGLASSPERLIRHLIGAHHDGSQFVFDLEILSCYPGGLEKLQAEVQDIVAADSPRARWLRDLTVYERYHEKLAEMVADAVAHGVKVSPEDAANPDMSFGAYMRWCAAQPRTPADTLSAWRRGAFALDSGLADVAGAS